MLRVEACYGARTCVEVCDGAWTCVEVCDGAWTCVEVRRACELTGFSAYGVRKSPYLQNKSFLAS